MSLILTSRLIAKLMRTRDRGVKLIGFDEDRTTLKKFLSAYLHLVSYCKFDAKHICMIISLFLRINQNFNLSIIDEALLTVIFQIETRVERILTGLFCFLNNDSSSIDTWCVFVFRSAFWVGFFIRRLTNGMRIGLSMLVIQWIMEQFISIYSESNQNKILVREHSNKTTVD